MAGECVFCEVVAGAREAHVVYDAGGTVAFLDRRPVFAGHTLVVTREHMETLADVPVELLGPLFESVQRVTGAVVAATESHGAFVAVNNTVSQSVPHLHVHVVPRRFKDGLKGFFWPRHPYGSDDEAAAVAAKIRAVLSS